MQLTAIIVLLLGLLGPGVVAAQPVQRIAAVVNEDVISIYDIEERIRLVAFSTGLQDTPEVRQRILPQVLRTLIDERLQLQEAKKRNISVSKREIEKRISQIEEQNNIPKGDLTKYLTRNGINFQTLEAQIRASVAWTKLIGRRLRPRVTIGNEEIEDVLARLKATQGQDEIRLAEIFLSVDTPEDESAIRQSAQRLVDEIRAGARFAALARQFSQSATAAVGGDLGWTAQSELDPDIANAVLNLRQGQIVGPIRTISGFRILTLIDRRKIGGQDPRKVRLKLNQLFMPVDESLAPDAVDARLERARIESETVRQCKDTEALARKLGVDRPQDLGTLSLADLSPLIRDAVVDVEAGRASAPVRVPGGIVVLVVCERSAPETALPSRDEIGKQIMLRRLDQMARRYLRDLRTAALIDVRV